jgi:hypothetical protein
MLFSCWSLKGGSGTTVVSAALANLLSRRYADGAVLVDLAGDAPAVLGRDDLDGPGVAEWLAAGDSVAPEGWSRLERVVSRHLSVVPRGHGPLGPGPRAAVLAAVLASSRREVVVDCGVLPALDDTTTVVGATHVFAAQATKSLLVTRACFLSLRRAIALPLCPSGVVVLREPGRDSFPTDAIETAIGAPVVAEVPFHPTVASAVDAGDLGRSVPRRLARALRAAS